MRSSWNVGKLTKSTRGNNPGGQITFIVLIALAMPVANELSPPQAGDLIVAQGEPAWPAKPLAKQAGEPWVLGLNGPEPAGSCYVAKLLRRVGRRVNEMWIADVSRGSRTRLRRAPL